MTKPKKDIRFQIRMTKEEDITLRTLAQKYNQHLGQFLIDSALELGNANPLYTKECCDFLLHLESLQKLLDSHPIADNNLNDFRTKLNKEAKELWQSLNTLTENT